MGNKGYIQSIRIGTYNREGNN